MSTSYRLRVMVTALPTRCVFYQSKVGVPLCSLESNSEYIYDAQWSPVHPAVLASADGEGKVDVWNLTLDSEVTGQGGCG